MVTLKKKSPYLLKIHTEIFMDEVRSAVWDLFQIKLGWGGVGNVQLKPGWCEHLIMEAGQ